ncbi:hypothetical protein F4818DRAFT_36654 [Hypoxylon cercidicola]|nr:hypothetical protein F4818DRAFT_36654 [Hypoxylon cercidicola]
MDTFALATGALFGAARQMNTMLFGASYSSVVGSAIPSVMNNITVEVSLSPTINMYDLTSVSAAGGVITPAIVGMTTSENETSERMVDSGVEIDTIVTVASIRPQDITQESQMTGAPAAVGHFIISQASATDAPDATSDEHHAEL